MDIGLIIYNEYYKSEKTDYCLNRFSKSLKANNIEPCLASSNQILINPEKYININPKFILMRDKFSLLARFFEKKGFFVINPSESIRICDNKAEMGMVLSENNIARPKTIISPETYSNRIGKEFLISIGDKLGYPIIVKKIKSSYGMGVYKADNLQELLKFSGYTTPLVFEEFIPIPYGEDIRVFVVGDQVICSMKRTAQANEFRSNIELGATASPYQACNTIKRLAVSAVKAVGAIYGGVDIINSDEPKVIEVNANSGFYNLDKINNIDTASYIIEYILERYTC